MHGHHRKLASLRRTDTRDSKVCSRAAAEKLYSLSVSMTLDIGPVGPFSFVSLLAKGFCSPCALIRVDVVRIFRLIVEGVAKECNLRW